MSTIPKVSVSRVHILYATALLICLVYIFVLSAPVRPDFKWLDVHQIRLQNDKVNLQGSFLDSAATGSQSNDQQQQQPWIPHEVEDLDETRLQTVEPYISAIMDPNSTSFERLFCPPASLDRYDGLRRNPPRTTPTRKDHTRRYFFALNLYQSAHILPRLLGSIIQAIRILGPEVCVLSIVGGRSDDGTTEILTTLRPHLEALGVKYYFGTSPIDPLEEGHDRITELANLRNLALDPLVRRPTQYASPDTIVIFLNDVAICPDDILELVYQYTLQQADMVCAMDWKDDGHVFYDSWVSRGINGDLFVEVPQSGSWDFVRNLFWNDPISKARLDAKLPIQVYACWNGATVFDAKPLFEADDNIRFRASYEHECYMGEPTLFCKDLWKNGRGRIAVIPSVNVGYSDESGRIVKRVQGYTSDNVDVFNTSNSDQSAEEEEDDSRTKIRNSTTATMIDWKTDPPGLVKCQPDWHHPSWVEWDEPAARDRKPFDWSGSGYFNAKKEDTRDE
ncbi:hypothetical protein LTS17_012418 [Exophiala oligosperma]